MTSHSPIFRTWARRLDSYAQGEPIPESMINALRNKVLGSFQQAKMTDAERDEIRARVDVSQGVKLGWAITPAQTMKGLSWIQVPRNFRTFGEDEQEIIRDFARFTFEGLRLVGNRYGRREWLAVYRVHSKGGRSFSYSATPWQAGAYA